MSTPTLISDYAPAGLLEQLHQCRILLQNNDSDWQTHIYDWLTTFHANVECAISEQIVDAIRPSICTRVHSRSGKIEEFERPFLTGWARVAGALSHELDPEGPDFLAYEAYEWLIDWCFKEIAQNCSVTDEMLSGQMFKKDLKEFAEAWDVPAAYAILDPIPSRYIRIA